VTDEVPPASGHVGAGAQIASYRLEDQIGWGGMAVVYRALDVRLDRWVALKILAPEIARDDSFRQRFISESRAAAAVDHPHIIPVFEAGEADGVLFIAMRYVGGGDVRTLCRRLGPQDVTRVASIVTQVASALDASHAVGLVHRDVKPANMLLGTVAGGGRPDHVYLADFGLSKQALSTAGLTLTGQFVGTLDYMAPEQIEGRPVDGRADLYALACAAFEMLSGAPPFNRDQDLGVVFAQLSQAPPALTERRPDLPPEIDRVLTRALAKSPGDRQESCLEFATALRVACGLEWGASGQLQAGPLQAGPPRVVTELAAPSGMAGPANARDPAAGPEWRSAPSLPQAARTPGRPAPTVVDRGGSRPAGQWPAGQGRSGPSSPGQGWTAPSSPGQGRSGPSSPGQRRTGPSWPGQGPAGRHSPAPGGRSRARALAITVVAGIVILGIAGGAYAFLRDHGAAPSGPAAGASPSGAVRRGGPQIARSPAATVKAYIAAINGHHYQRAWKLGGRNGPSHPYLNFVRGYDTTARDTVHIVSVSGDVVTARLTAQQTDGIVKTYQGTYTVQNGVITKFDVQPTS
jgi:serine/threonine protein kinase